MKNNLDFTRGSVAIVGAQWCDKRRRSLHLTVPPSSREEFVIRRAC